MNPAKADTQVPEPVQVTMKKEELRILGKLAKSGFIPPEIAGTNPWSSTDVDKMEFIMTDKEYFEVIDACRFFYLHDPIVATTLDKMVEIGINSLVFYKNGLTDNEMRIFTGIQDKLEEFCQAMAMEYLLSGLVIPEITLGTVAGEELKEHGIKKYSSLVLPVSLWLRDPKTITIKDTGMGDNPAFFAKVPDEMVYFIMNGGKYSDGTANEVLWANLNTYFTDFVRDVESGKREFLLENDDIFRRRPITGSPYPTPFLYRAVESLKHKRNLRRMDYSLASRAIGAIQLFKLGNDNFPVTEDDTDLFDWIRGQMFYRNSSSQDLERIFQLFANHTLTIEWVYPPMEALLNGGKYEQVDEDIIFALGFPRILITGEASKTGTSQPEFAVLSPKQTMEQFRKKILQVIRGIVYDVSKANHLKTEPIVKFKPLNLIDYKSMLQSLADLYKGGNVSRTTYADELGYNWNDEADLMEEENKTIKEKKIATFAPQPFAADPNNPNGNPNANKPGATVAKTSPNKSDKPKTTAK